MSTSVSVQLNQKTSLDRFGWLKRASYYYDDLARLFQFHCQPDSKVLEIGSGVGQILSRLNPSSGMGLDINPSVAADARTRFPRFQFAAWSGDTPLPKEVIEQFPGGVDYILLVNATGLWQDIQFSLQHLKPICNQSTRIISVYYNFLWAPAFKLAQWMHLKMPQPDLNWLSADDVSNLFRLSGYRVIKNNYRCLLPVNLGPVSSFVNRVIANLPLLNRFCCVHVSVARVATEVPAKDTRVSIIIPARNEKGNIEGAVRRLSQVAKNREEEFEIVFVEGGSSDGTWEEILRVSADANVPKPGPILYCKQKGKGKGDACREGYKIATGNLFLILDADLTVPPEDVPKFLDVYAKGYGEFINGCRLVYKMEKEAMRPINLLGNKFFSYAFTWLLGQRFKDTLCGTKVFSRENYAKIAKGRSYFGDFDPFGDFDLIFGATKLDLEIAEVPIRYLERSYGSTNISRWKHGWLLLKMCVFALGRIKFVR